MKAIFYSLVVVFCLLFFITHAQAGSITLRVIAVNPSEETSQVAPVKVYLPVEAKPEDIIYKEDLGVAYDTQQGSYYVFGEYELKPTEVKEFEIEVKDIWTIEDSRIVALRKEAKDIFSAFEKTAYAQKADLLYKGIEKKLNEIEEIQKIPANSPTQHISDYRYALSLLNSVETDLVSAKTLLVEVGPTGMAKLTWKIIVFIIVFLGILGLGFYIIWQRQSQLISEQKT